MNSLGTSRCPSPPARARVAAEWGTAPPSEPGTDAKDMLASFGDGVQGALTVGENPPNLKGNPGRVRRRLEALDTLVVVDIMLNEAQDADVVLPALTRVKKEGTYTNLERRIQQLQQIKTLSAQARSEYTILKDVDTC